MIRDARRSRSTRKSGKKPLIVERIGRKGVVPLEKGESAIVKQNPSILSIKETHGKNFSPDLPAQENIGKAKITRWRGYDHVANTVYGKPLLRHDLQANIILAQSYKKSSCDVT